MAKAHSNRKARFYKRYGQRLNEGEKRTMHAEARHKSPPDRKERRENSQAK
jgi:hypothetical protein